ncbi:MAG TPA: o-succinylbenzoate synthase [Candidatus Dormibacteraeota bacterium]|nr:o-succinylbenzoate synthase [Candidatus Dormibacteraeota bacterium]
MTRELPQLRVERARLRIVELPLVSPFTTSFGTQTVRRALLVEVEGEGVAGVGECAAGIEPGYSSETCAGALLALRDYILPSVLGGPKADVAGHAKGWAWVRGHHMAKAAVEMALLDQSGKASGRSLAQILGGSRSRIGCGVSIGIQASLGATLTAIEGYLGEGYQRIKLKCKPGYDIELARAVRQRFPGTPLMLDANSAYSLGDLDQLRALDEFDLTMIEQPLAHDDLIDHAALQAQIETSICLDESVESLADLRAAISLGSGRILNIKAGRVGGLFEAVQLHDTCKKARWPVWCGGMLETGIGRAANLALASLPGFTLPGDTSASGRYFEQDILRQPFELARDGTLAVPTSPGLGVELDQRRLEQTTVHLEELGSR